MIDVATIQTQTNAFEKRVIIATRQGESVLLDSCPAGTMDVHSFASAAKAAEFMGVSASTIYRQRRQFEAENA